ncbi:MAG: DNA-binding protein [Euryarchaeota archaeon]|nr:DNA-binding protein [Euryarchaeota archaeon]
MNYVREVAHRIFAAELNESSLQVKEECGQYSSKYLLTPTGARCSRIFLVGTLIEKEYLGNKSLLWRTRISDPSGIFYMYAGRNHPEPAKVLEKTALLEYLAVIGKTSTYTTKSGNVITSIWAESLQVVDEATRDRWVMDTASYTITRLLKLRGNNPDAVMVRDHYSTNIDRYSSMVKNALITLKTVDNSIIQKIEQILTTKSRAKDIESNLERELDELDAIDYDELEKEWLLENFMGMQGDYDLMKYYCEAEAEPI